MLATVRIYPIFILLIKRMWIYRKQFVDVLEPKKTTTYYILSKSIANTIDAKISN